MTEKTKNLFTSIEWERDDPIVIGDRAGKFRMFSPNTDKFMVEFPDLDQGGVDRRWFDIDELPPKDPKASSVMHGKVVAVGQFRAAWSDKSVPYCEVIAENDDGTFEIEVVRVNDRFKKTETASQIRTAWWRLLDGVPEINQPTMLKNEAETDAQTLQTETTSVLDESPASPAAADQQPEVKQEAQPDDKPEESIADVAKAVHEHMKQELTDTPPAPPQEVDTVSQPEADATTEATDDDCTGEPIKLVRERKIEAFIIRKGDVFRTDEASARLNEIIAEGYRLENIEYSSMYIPHYEKSYVETVVYWTFLRLKEPIG